MIQALLLSAALAGFTSINANNIGSLVGSDIDLNGNQLVDGTGSVELGTACALGDAGDVCVGEDLHYAGCLTGLNGATYCNTTNNEITWGDNSETLTETWSSNTVTLSSATGVSVYSFGSIAPTVAVRSKTFQVPIGSLLTPAAATPTVANCGVGACLLFATDVDDVAYFSWRVPDDIAADTDVTLSWLWSASSGDPLALNETVTWQVQSRAHIAGEDFNGGSANDQSVTYTETDNPDSEREIKNSTIVLDEDDADQPFVAGDMLAFSFRRDVDTDNYSGAAQLLQFVIEYQSTSLIGD